MAKERYAMLGVETDQALDTLAQIPISLHCWQGDDLAGFETPNAELGSGLAATGNYKSPKSFLSNLSTHSKHRYSQIGFVLRSLLVYCLLQVGVVGLCLA